MTISTFTSRAFNQDTSRAKKAAKNGPVFITERGTPAHVLLSIEDYHHLTAGQISLGEALSQQDGVDFDFTPDKIQGLFQVADLS